MLIISVLYFQSACVCQDSHFSGLYLLLIQTLGITSAALKSVCGFLLILQCDALTKATEEGKGFLAPNSRAQSIMAGKWEQQEVEAVGHVASTARKQRDE